MTLLEDLWYGNVNPHEAILTETGGISTCSL